MKIRAKFHGIILLFSAYSIVLLWCAWYASGIAPALLFRNYRTIQYASQMESALTNVFLASLNAKEALPSEMKRFEENLELERSNITEPGEGEAVERLASEWHQFVTPPVTPSVDSFQRVATALKELKLINEKGMFALEAKALSLRYTVIAGGGIGFFLFVVYAMLIASSLTEAPVRGAALKA